MKNPIRFFYSLRLHAGIWWVGIFDLEILAMLAAEEKIPAI